MTTVAYDGTSVSVDSQITNGNTKQRTNKVIRLKGGALLFPAGKLNDAFTVKRWWDRTGGEGDPPAVTEGFGAILIHKGQAYMLADGAELLPIREKFCAIGSGRDFALACMDLGLSAEQGVKMACKYDAYSSGPIRTFKL